MSFLPRPQWLRVLPYLLLEQLILGQQLLLWQFPCRLHGKDGWWRGLDIQGLF